MAIVVSTVCCLFRQIWRKRASTILAFPHPTEPRLFYSVRFEILAVVAKSVGFAFTFLLAPRRLRSHPLLKEKGKAYFFFAGSLGVLGCQPIISERPSGTRWYQFND